MMAYAQNLADSVSIIALNPKNGEIYAMTDYPDCLLYTSKFPTSSYISAACDKEHINRTLWYCDVWHNNSMWYACGAGRGLLCG